MWTDDCRRRSERLQRKQQKPTATSSMLLQDLPEDVLVHQLAPQLCLPGKHVLSAVCRKWRGLSDWQSVKHVCTKLSGGDGQALLQALCPTRPMVLLWGSIQDKDRRKAVVRRLCAVLASHASNVGTLYAIGFGLTKGMATLLSDALRSSRLRALVLDDNRSFSPSGVRRIAAALDEVPLEELSLRRVNVSDSGALALGRALARNRTLLSLDLTEGDVRTPGLVAFAQAFGGRNRTLRRLTLARNGFVTAKDHGYTHTATRPSSPSVKRCNTPT